MKRGMKRPQMKRRYMKRMKRMLSRDNDVTGRGGNMSGRRSIGYESGATSGDRFEGA